MEKISGEKDKIMDFLRKAKARYLSACHTQDEDGNAVIG